MIPKIIHYIWFGDQSKKPLERISSWKEKLPDFEFKEWNESNLDISKHKLSQIGYKLGKYGPASDFIRPDLLCEYGGIWLDTDVIIHERLDPFLDYSFFIGYEEAHHLNIGTIGSEAHHPILERVRQWLHSNGDNMSISEMNEYEFLKVYMCYSSLAIALLGAMKTLYGFVPNGKSATIAEGVRVEASPVFTIRGNYEMKNYIEHLYEGSWRLKYDYVKMLKDAYEQNIPVKTNIWKDIITKK
jgi:hypothetical protein